MTTPRLIQKRRRLALYNRERQFFAHPSGDIRELLLAKGGAGSYADVPSRRMAHDADGTLFFHIEGGAFSFWTAPDHVGVNAESPTFIAATKGSAGGSAYMVLIFPELREIDGSWSAFATSSGAPARTEQDSADTTNGWDGTWNTIRASVPNTTVTDPNYRTQIVSLASSNKRAIRQTGLFSDPGGAGDWRVRHWHVYGEIAAGETPDRLLWIDNALGTEFGLPIDYGDIPRGSAEDKAVKLRNNSTTLSAGSVQVTAESLYLTSGAWFTFSEGGAFQSTLPLASSISASSDSPVITLRRITPDSEAFGLKAARAYANVGSWT